jgi:hypothetical protein
MPWPPNLGHTWNPWSLAYSYTVLAILLNFVPGLHSAIAAKVHSRATWLNVWILSSTSPIITIAELSPWNPFLKATTSILSQSPSYSTYELGTPWAVTSLTDRQQLLGKWWKSKALGYPPSEIIRSWTILSISFNETPALASLRAWVKVSDAKVAASWIFSSYPLSQIEILSSKEGWSYWDYPA